MIKKCAIYTRVSTSMQAEVEYNSCEAQKDRILSFIKSQEDLEFSGEYSDPGYSGGDLDRPALKALLGDIENKKIDVVLTYKIDRLTRSSKDFYALIEFFEKYGVSYVSVTERFDTSSPSGRLLRNIMLTFAQFEREMTSERIKDKLEQKALKGLYNGGLCPFGYQKIDKKLVIDKKDSKEVLKIYEIFIETGSFKKAMDYAKEKGLKHSKTNKPLSAHGVYRILRNPVYIGKVHWRGKFFDGIHEGIVSKEIFEEAQSLTKEKVIKKRLFKEYCFSRLIKCQECGSSMTNTFTNKKDRRYYYYKCIKVVKEGSRACSIKEINAERIETFLIKNLNRIAQDKQYIESLVFKTLFQTPQYRGFELTEEFHNNYTSRVLHVLQRYVSFYKSGNQFQRAVLTKKIIQRINFSRETIEVIINIEDTKNPLDELKLIQEDRLSSARMREGAANFDAPACSPSFGTNNTGELRLTSNQLPFTP